MQHLRPVEASPVKSRRGRIALCDLCRSPLGEKRVLTRDVEGLTRRFCGEDNICIAAWQRHNRSVFRRGT